MEYFVAVDANSPAGLFLLSLKGKIGGASSVIECGLISHPVLVCKDLDWKIHPGFVRMTQIRNPGAPDPQPREIALPSSALLLVAAADATATQPPALQTPPLH